LNENDVEKQYKLKSFMKRGKLYYGIIMSMYMLSGLVLYYYYFSFMLFRNHINSFEI